MQISFYIGDAYFNGFANPVNKTGEPIYLVELDNQPSFYVREVKDGTWTSDHTKGNKMIYDMVCATGAEITFRLLLEDPDSAEPGAYSQGCGMTDHPTERNAIRHETMN